MIVCCYCNEPVSISDYGWYRHHDTPRGDRCQYRLMDTAYDPTNDRRTDQEDE